METKETKSEEMPAAVIALQEAIQASISEAIAGMDSPGIRDREMVSEAVEALTIRKKLVQLSKKIKKKTPQVVKDLQKEAKDLKERLTDLALSLETRVAGDAQILLDETDEDNGDD